MISGSLVALVTPMHRDGAVDWEALQRLVEWHVACQRTAKKKNQGWRKYGHAAFR